MAAILDSSDLAGNRSVAQTSENTEGFGVRWAWFQKSVCPFLMVVGRRKSLVGAMVEGRRFSHARVGDSNKEGVLGR